ncbi:MAG TPA: HAMP domain-containing sensor histidine kinase [Rhizomicrobium sp.]|nr:HAMP domain-containing sensor histidine kinase [Rhizomicrobium sp.]
MAQAAAGPIGAALDAAAGKARAASRKVRLTVVVAFVLIAGSFAAAAGLQMRLDRVHALAQASHFTQRRAGEIAADLSASLDRYAALGAAFANAGGADGTAAISEAGGPALRNIALLDRGGQVVSELKSMPNGLLPLSPAALAHAAYDRTIAASSDGRTLALLFPLAGHIAAVQIDAAAILPRAGMEDALIASLSGEVRASGAQWTAVPIPSALALDGRPRVTRLVELPAGNRMISLARVPGWPLAAGASILTGDALGTWYGTLPLYLFLILGPSLAGAALAAVFVRDFERRARVAEAAKALRATEPGDARLLIRLADAERRAAEAERSKSEFIAHMSHELRTPLNAIIGFSEVIERGVFGPAGHVKYIEYAHDIGAAGRNLHAKIGDILEFANLEAGKHPLAPAMIDAAVVARQAVEEFAGKAFSRRIRLTVSLPECAPVFADTAALRRILANLIANAVQYTPEGGQVRLQLRNEDDVVVFSLRDSGYGFDAWEAAAAGKPFTAFKRPAAATGAGLGLAIAMALARRMGGTINLGGGPDEGAAAELRLPAS